MLSSTGYTAVMLQTGAAFLQVAVPLGTGSAASTLPADEVISSSAWSDQAYRFKFSSVPISSFALDEKQSRALHEALIASFEEFILPIELS